MVKLEGDINRGVIVYKKDLYYNWHYANAIYNLGVDYGEILKFDMAIVFYELAFHFTPHCAEAYNNLGIIYKDCDNLDKAVECYQLALSVKLNFSQSLNNLGVVYIVQGKIDAAASMIEKVIIRVVYRDAGDIALAINAYEKCLKIDPDSRNAGQNRLLAMNYIDEGNDDKLFGAHSGHWILTVINDTKDKVYFLDSLGNRTRAVRAFNASKGKKMVTTFKQLTGNLKRRPGTLECGFCVCRYMKEIIESDDPDLEKMYGGGPVRDKYYSQAQYDEVLDDWSQFIYPHLI
ncbi:hypothetical protein OROMI_018954 [Orobanche minor]